MADYNGNKYKIYDAFKNVSKVWAYTIMYHGVAIGIWDSQDKVLKFHDSAKFCWDYVTELRVFNNKRELRFIRDEHGVLLFRDSLELEEMIECSNKQDTSYLMYGTNIAHAKDSELTWSILSEDRGGKLYFPYELEDSEEAKIWLGIRNFLQIVDSSVGGVRLEVCDYVFTEFKQSTDKFGEQKKEVKLNG